jgi:hypothetical protein
MSRATFGKPLKGVGTLSAKFTSPIERSIIGSISTGTVSFENVQITGGTIDGVLIGANLPGPAFFTTLQVGTPTGTGYSACFYGNTIGESACWEPVLGRWNIQGELRVADMSDLGNLRIMTNTISSTNLNGNIIIDPNGSGNLVVLGGITQTSGNISLDTNNGVYNLTSGSITSIASTDINLTAGGNVTVNPGTGKMIVNGDLEVIGTTTKIDTIVVTVADPVLTLGGDTPVLIDDNKDRGIEFRYNDGTNPRTGFFGYDDSSNCFTFIPQATNTNEVFSGAVGNVCFGGGTFTSINSPGPNTLGATSITDLTITGSITGPIGVSTEHLSIAGGGSINPSITINMTFITITSSGTATGTLLPPTTDGFQKYILITSLFTSSRYELQCPAGILIDPGTGTTAAKKITFEYGGQSIFIVWDNISTRYIIVGGNACIGSP